MLSKIERSFSIIFIIVVLLELMTSIYSLSWLHYFTKPAIVTLLLFFFLKQSSHLNNYIKKITILALLFSLLGDILLMFVDVSSNFFIGGLIAFLLAHISYIFVFFKNRDTAKKPYVFITTLLIYAFGLFYLIKGGLGNLLAPVVIYIFVILLMATFAFLRKDKIKNNYWFIFIGALFFMLSDSILAANKFYKPLPFSGVFIMLTYSIAQYLIVLGILKQKD